ncbi:MAG: 1-deoxy-D-xylulose-5-phosphate reductoisomerase [Acidobacteria bacterium]|nr:1-deoxy-D-xylulose-5-phosphate reductoisomerase [Acidobacteriota bacterium]
MPQRICLLGSTGSIGTSTLDVVRNRPDLFSIASLVAGVNIDLLAAQIVEFRPGRAVIANEADLPKLTAKLAELGLNRSDWPDLSAGAEARVSAATCNEADFVMSAIVGVAGLEATYRAVCQGKRIGLANKEVLVAGGELVTAAAREHGCEMIPVDSEHNGAHECLRAGRRNEVLRLILTASGGPFRETPASEFENITPAQALKHPTWVMGQRITIDSATLMKKGFEVIEACWLFDFRPNEVDVVVHPQSTVHAMVEFNDGSIITQVCATDMRMPIQYALTYPERLEAPVPRYGWTEPRTWQFYPPDPGKFRLLQLSYDALNAGGSATCTLNAADEIAVEAFLRGEISFASIAAVVEDTLQAVPVRQMKSVEQILDVDRQSRDRAREYAVKRQRNLMHV